MSPYPISFERSAELSPDVLSQMESFLVKLRSQLQESLTKVCFLSFLNGKQSCNFNVQHPVVDDLRLAYGITDFGNRTGGLSPDEAETIAREVHLWSTNFMGIILLLFESLSMLGADRRTGESNFADIALHCCQTVLGRKGESAKMGPGPPPRPPLPPRPAQLPRTTERPPTHSSNEIPSGRLDDRPCVHK